MTSEGDDATARPAVPRARDAEPDRVRRHLSAAGGAARPLPAANVGRLSRARGRVAGAGRAGGAPAGRGRAAAAGRPRDAARHAGARARRSTSRSRSASTWSTSSPRRATRQSIQVGASPRGSLALLKLSRCRAALDGRDYVTPDDVKSVAVPALAHRLTLAARAVGAAHLGRGRRPRAARARCRRRPPKTSPSLDPRDAMGDAEARGVREPLGGRAAGRARLRAPRARRADRAVPARARRRARARHAAAAHGRRRARRRRARSRATRLPARIALESATPVDRLDVYVRLPDGVELGRRAATRSRCASQPASGASSS